jgi:hypothetical protein
VTFYYDRYWSGRVWSSVPVRHQLVGHSRHSQVGHDAEPAPQRRSGARNLQTSRNPSRLNTHILRYFKSLYRCGQNIRLNLCWLQLWSGRLTAISGSLPKYRLIALERAAARDAECRAKSVTVCNSCAPLRLPTSRACPSRSRRSRSSKRTGAACQLKAGAVTHAGTGGVNRSANWIDRGKLASRPTAAPTKIVFAGDEEPSAGIELATPGRRRAFCRSAAVPAPSAPHRDFAVAAELLVPATGFAH